MAMAVFNKKTREWIEISDKEAVEYQQKALYYPQFVGDIIAEEGEDVFSEIIAENGCHPTVKAKFRQLFPKSEMN